MRLHQMSNDELLESRTSIAANERQLVTNVLIYLIEIEERGLHFELAYKSLHDFCVRKLALSEAEAYRRVAAARLVRRFGAADRARIGPNPPHDHGDPQRFVTESNLESLIGQAAEKTKRQVLELRQRRTQPDLYVNVAAPTKPRNT